MKEEEKQKRGAGTLRIFSKSSAIGKRDIGAPQALLENGGNSKKIPNVESKRPICTRRKSSKDDRHRYRRKGPL